MVRRTANALSLPLFFVIAALSAAKAESLDQLYEKAKAEKALVFYTGAGPGAAKATAEAFETRFPGIAVTATGNFSNVLDADIDRQLKNNRILTDVAEFNSIEDFYRWEQERALMHFKPAGFDQILPEMKDPGGAWVTVNAIPIFYGYNPDKVQETDVPKSALDFLKPQFRSKLVSVYPKADDASLYNFYLVVQKYGWDYMKSYMANEPYLIVGHRDVAARLRSGADWVSLDVSGGQGPNLKIVMSEKDKTPVFLNAAGILKNAPHPNAAKLFVTWLISKEEQSRVPARYSPRADIPPPPGMPPLTSGRFAKGYRDFLENVAQLPELRKRFESYTGPIINKATH
jgi:ABC-type Fe3+ transport system substrate-binding protein